MPSNGKLINIDTVQVHKEIILGTLDNRENYGNLTVSPLDEQNNLYYKTNNDMEVRLTSGRQRFYQQMEKINFILYPMSQESMVDITKDTMGFPTRWANYSRRGSIGSFHAGGNFVTATGSGQVLLDFYLGSLKLISTGFITLPNVGGQSGSWVMDVEFLVKDVGEAGSASVKVTGKITFSDKQGNSASIPFVANNGTTFQTTTTENLDVKIEAMNVNSMDCEQVSMCFLA